MREEKEVIGEQKRTAQACFHVMRPDSPGERGYLPVLAQKSLLAFCSAAGFCRRPALSFILLYFLAAPALQFPPSLDITVPVLNSQQPPHTVNALCQSPMSLSLSLRSCVSEVTLLLTTLFLTLTCGM